MRETVLSSFHRAETVVFHNTIKRRVIMGPSISYQGLPFSLLALSFHLIASLRISTQKPDDHQIEPPSFFIRALGLDEYVILTWLLSNLPLDLVLQQSAEINRYQYVDHKGAAHSRTSH